MIDRTTRQIEPPGNAKTPAPALRQVSLDHAWGVEVGLDPVQLPVWNTDIEVMIGSEVDTPVRRIMTLLHKSDGLHPENVGKVPTATRAKQPSQMPTPQREASQSGPSQSARNSLTVGG